MLHDRLYLATIAAGADETASRFGLGLEIDEFCTAANFDADFDRWDGVARAHLAHSDPTASCSTRPSPSCVPAPSTRWCAT